MSGDKHHLSIDPITVEVIHSGLRSIADETFVALMKSAYSTNIKERHDHSSCLMDASGRIVVQASRSQSIHLSSMLGHVRTLLKTYALSDMNEGDIFISNDPYVAGGTHLPDVNFAIPVFDNCKVVGFSCNIAHHADIGGMAPGSMSANMTEIYQEGVRLPVVRLYTKGRLEEDLFSVLLLNIRVPEERRGDYMAQVAACRLGQRRMLELFDTHGTEITLATMSDIIQRTEMRLRRSVGELPDGRYTAEDFMDNDGNGTENILIKLAVEIDGDSIHFDFTGTASQVLGNINCPMTATKSAVCYTLKALIDPSAPDNHGILNVVEVTAPSGSLLNPIFPAAVAFRAHTTQRIVDVVMKAFAKFLPDRVLGDSNGSNTTAVFSGVDPRTGSAYLYFETLGGGCGARASKDGKDGVQQHIANTANLPVEAIETEYPLRVREYTLAPDTGGAGKFRGGLALRRIIAPVDHDCIFTGAGERFTRPPEGIFGGLQGRPGAFSLLGSDGNRTDLGGKPAPLPCKNGQAVEMRSPGAGGYGSPKDRRPESLFADLASGKFSSAYMSEHYSLTKAQLTQLPADDTQMDYEWNEE